MTEKLLKILSSYLFASGKLPKDFKLEYVEDSYGDYIKFNIDLSKVDINSPNYDAGYAKYFTKPKGMTGLQLFTYDWDKNMEFQIKDFMDISGLDSKYERLRAFNTFVNYDYFDSIGDKIEEKIKETNYPNVTVEFEKDKNPEIKILFRNFKIEQWSYTQDFIKELKELLSPDIDLDAYSQAFAQPRK